ncbi:hypothetical protein PtB15_1B665 [Puccinia triticina]|nr:hypothetical protein PtB15_1B665 [Puccinia triticina]
MKSTFNFSPMQLQWLQAKQIFVDAEMERVVAGAGEITDDGINVKLAYQFQAKLFADAADMRIPQWAVPDVTATWNAIRNRHRKGPVCANFAGHHDDAGAQGTSTSGTFLSR